jgi:hypothetical protein
VDSEWLQRAVNLYNRAFDRQSMSWSAQAAFDRGSFATLIGISLAQRRSHATIFAIGDSLAVLTDGHALVSSFPYHCSEQFIHPPRLLSTVWENNAKFVQGYWRTHTVHWPIARIRTPAILAMTDALGAWLLTAPRTRLHKLLEVKSKRQFEALVEHERVVSHLRRDDTTLLVIR